MNTPRLYFLILTLMMSMIFPVKSMAQGTMLFLNGKEKRFSSAEVKGEYIHYTPEGDDPDWKRLADRYNVFALQYDDGREEIIYVPDTTDGGDPTVEEVRDYIKGEKLAIAEYRKPMNFVGGVLTGAAGSLVNIYGLPVPLVYATVVGRFNPKVPPAPEGQVYSEHFQAGYQRKARNMKIKNSLIGGAIGFGVGLTALILFYSND